MISTNLLFCVRHSYEENHIGELHSHPCYELVYYIDGAGTIEFNGKLYSFKKGDYMICKKDVNHLETDIAGTEVLYIGFDLYGSEAIFEGVFEDANKDILPLLENIYYEVKHWNEDFSYQITNHYASIIALKLLQTHIDIENVVELERLTIDNIGQYIIQNFNQDLKTEELAKMAGYSYDHFRKEFKKRYGCNVNDFILNKRINVANDMLQTGEFLIKEISVACGFNSISAFCTKYKEIMGITPNEMKVKAKEDNNDIEKDKFSMKG